MSNDPLDLLGPQQKRSTVTFAEPTRPSTAATGRSNLDSLFGDPGPRQSTAEGRRNESATTPAPATRRPRPTSTDLFGGPSTSQEAPVTQQTPSVPITQTSQSDTESILRIQRLEKEIERLNREIDDLTRRKKRDEEDLEKEWREKLGNKEKSWLSDREEMEKGYQKQIQRLTEQNENDMERLRENYSRQIEALQSSNSQTRDVVGVVEKVDRLSSQISDLVHSVGGSGERIQADLETTLRIRETQIESREQNLKSELDRFKEEKDNVTLLNLKLKDLVQQQEDGIQKEKWKIREDWNRLSAERKIFKEDQRFVLESIEKQKRMLETTKESFFKEQHDLLIRVSNEKESLEREQQQFQLKRSADVRRLKEEATQLQHRIQNVQLAEEHSESLRLHYEAKYKQLCELEASLMEECMELENLRNRGFPIPESTQHQPRHEGRVIAINRVESRPPPPVVNEQFPDFPIDSGRKERSDSVRAVLRKHADFLEKYTGQRVAAVAPRNPSLDEWQQGENR
ncbi:unnamed protein product, partial [Mesorhabditis belari]|uniref:Fas-binding factor 1 C-terminal domain-containing protein n=1 Tax=Mesorhabditis belari TaxID=2138241 RepID=A0AAF3EH44_9BILA